MKLRPQRPERCALTKLRYSPTGTRSIAEGRWRVKRRLGRAADDMNVGMGAARRMLVCDTDPHSAGLPPDTLRFAARAADPAAKVASPGEPRATTRPGTETLPWLASGRSATCLHLCHPLCQ